MREVLNRWRKRYGRAALVVLMGAGSYYNVTFFAHGMERVALAALILLCTGAMLATRLPWYVAPALLAVASARLGVSLLPLFCISLFSLAFGRRARAAVALAAAALSANTVVMLATSVWPLAQLTTGVLLSSLSIVAGMWRGSQRRNLQLLADQVEHLRIQGTLREQAARSAERSRIAAEMHDVLAHRLSLIALHAGVLAGQRGTLPERVADRLDLLRTASTDALTDLRGVLGALRTEDTGSGTAPVLRPVEQLAEEARAAGQNVDLTVVGRPDQAPTTHRLAVYRIVQEALTNVRKHAGRAPATVIVDYRPPETTVEVTNAAGAPAIATVSSGYGLVGLRERITALGGRLDAGRTGSGHWSLAGRIPHDAHADHPASTDQNGSRP
ncbi:histidine kinase [Actinoplanes sp. DH11]|uniref:sensor histidine kinase n=1 Tax=Actinoplanes sp. DH11 TaxID=2857011 RepID=UPI001E4B5957|nr:histidine kinase [Actinoplanes sp. DH11]